MQKIQTLLNVYQKRGVKGLPLERVYKELFDRDLFLMAYGKVYRNQGAMTRGVTPATVDDMSVQKIDAMISLLRMERYKWTPVRRTYIEKANGKMRPLGIPTWSDKLLQEVIRSLLEPYYEQRLSTHSHGFRPHRGCHSALTEIRKYWKGTVWFIEGDIKGCFDNIGHQILLEIIRRDIPDGRLLNLIRGLLEAGYVEDWRRYDTLNGTPQGGIISPLLSNIYLNDFDKFVEDKLIPAYTRGKKRSTNPEFGRLWQRRRNALRRKDFPMVKDLTLQLRSIPSVDVWSLDYRRLRYVRYADDFLFGFTGPRKEAEEIRQRIGDHLGQTLKLTLSMEKTLITHAVDEKAKFLGYEIKVMRDGNKLANTGDHGKRATNGNIALLMPTKVVQKYRERHCKNGRVVHRKDLTPASDYTIVQRFQSVLHGLYNYYCMAVNVSKRMNKRRWMLHWSMVKTLAHKHKTKTSKIHKKYQVDTPEGRKFQVVVKRREKAPLIAEFGGFAMIRIPEGMGVVDCNVAALWHKHNSRRSEVIRRMLAGKCELCGKKGPVAVHHIRKLADINRPGRRPKTDWEKFMSAMKRKTLVVCTGKDGCHQMIHSGRYDGRAL